MPSVALCHCVANLNRLTQLPLNTVEVAGELYAMVGLIYCGMGVGDVAVDCRLDGIVTGSISTGGRDWSSVLGGG